MTGCPGWCVYQGEHAREHYSHQGPITTAESCHVMLSASSGATEIALRHLDLESMVYVPLADAARTSTLLAHLGHHSLAAAIKSAADLAGADATADLDDMGDDITDALMPEHSEVAHELGECDCPDEPSSLVPDVDDYKGGCCAYHPNGLLCTLETGHAGDHEAHGSDHARPPYRTWPQDALAPDVAQPADLPEPGPAVIPAKHAGQVVNPQTGWLEPALSDPTDRTYAEGQVIEYTSFDRSGYSPGQVVRYADEMGTEPEPMIYIRAKSGGKPFPVRESQLRAHHPYAPCTIGERPDVIPNPFGMIESLPEVTL